MQIVESKRAISFALIQKYEGDAVAFFADKGEGRVLTTHVASAQTCYCKMEDRYTSVI